VGPGAAPDWRDALAQRVRGELVRDAPLAPRTSIRIGGPADLLVRPADPDDVVACLRAAREHGVAVHVLGGGANTLVADRGVRGVVLRLPLDLGGETAGPPRLVLPAGMPTARAVQRAHGAGLVGAEFLRGIPGTLGGALAMNAGTRAGEMRDVVTHVEVATADGVRELPAGELGFAYRTCRLPDGAVVLRVGLRLRPGDVAAAARAMDAEWAQRALAQPLDLPSFGSTFRNPPGDFAGRLVEAAGLKGERIGGAEVSTRHANFVVNVGGASARDVLLLVRRMRDRVREASGVTLETEVRLVGDFADDETLD
jgi:UDP-N-acetylmuramate dehydrogenase